ncbi:MAG: MBL fold metallo-hydrolase, partial [Dehalococcoidales bacterium]|nr:MBL fold metallo-hydrolase [Dehalococcoidales bacterium]
MDITWLGLSCFRIRGSQAVIITDPFPPSLGYSLGRQTADIVTVSHPHPGHSYAEGVEGKPRIVRGPGEYEISNVLILGIATYHDAVRGGTRGKNTVYLMEVDGVNILHLGDIGHVLSGEQAEEIGRVDVLLLPVGGVNTIGAATAAQLVRSLEPKVVIPMHYRTPQLKRELEPLDGFLREMGLTQVEPRAKLTPVSYTHLRAH